MPPRRVWLASETRTTTAANKRADDVRRGRATWADGVPTRPAAVCESGATVAWAPFQRPMGQLPQIGRRGVLQRWVRLFKELRSARHHSAEVSDPGHGFDSCCKQVYRAVTNCWLRVPVQARTVPRLVPTDGLEAGCNSTKREDEQAEPRRSRCPSCLVSGDRSLGVGTAL